MSNKIRINVFMHNLLIINEMNDFTVLEARNALLKEHSEFTDKIEARKFIYRQLTRYIEKGIIKRMNTFDGRVKQVVYSKTDKFFISEIVPSIRRPSKKRAIKDLPENVTDILNYEAELKKELIAYKIDLTTVLEEAKEYKLISFRFPELQERVNKHQSRAKSKSIQLLGKVQAIQNLLDDTLSENSSC